MSTGKKGKQPGRFLDVRIPIGLIFILFGGIMVIYGLWGGQGDIPQVFKYQYQLLVGIALSAIRWGDAYTQSEGSILKIVLLIPSNQSLNKEDYI